MAAKRNHKTSLDDFLSGVMAWTFIAVIFVALTAAGVYWWNFKHYEISSDPEKWGQLGDYLGGVINPIIGLATVFLIILSVSIQRRELRSSLLEMKQANEAASRMSFEQSLFTWLENYHSQIRDIDVYQLTGRTALLKLYKDYLSPKKIIHLERTASEITDERANEILRLAEKAELEGANHIFLCQIYATKKYSVLYKYQKANIDAPFRTLYRLIRWIDKSQLSIEQKWHYCTIVRSQLSWPELVFLYYNGMTKEGEKFVVYANKYAMFDNILSSDELIRLAIDKADKTPVKSKHMTYDGEHPWPYMESAFSSQIAKKILRLPVDA